MKKLLLIPLSLALFACQSKDVQYRAPTKRAAESTEGTLRIRIPGPSAFPMTNGNPTDFLHSYLLRITSGSKKCEEFQRYELADYKGADTLEYTVSAACDFRVRFAIGKEGSATGLQTQSLSFDAFYTTEDSFDVDPADFEAGDVDIKLHLKRTSLGQKLGFSSDWVRDDLTTDPTDPDKIPVDPPTNPDPTTTTTTTTAVSYAELKATIDSSCAVCHKPGGSRSSSDLSSYSAFKQYGSQAVARISAGTMPPSGALADSVVKKFKDWQTAGFPEAATTNNTNTNTNTNNNNTNNNSGDDRVVEFHIKAGTGSGAWNTQDTQVNVKVGQILRLINDDTIKHRFHTYGQPCPHGNDIPPGKSEDCVISQPYTGKALYDHNTNGDFYIRAER